MKKIATKKPAKKQVKKLVKSNKKKSPVKLLKEAIAKSKTKTKALPDKPVKKVSDTDNLIKHVNLEKYGFIKRSIYRRKGNFIKDCGEFCIALIKCSNLIDYNVEIFNNHNDFDGIYIKTIKKEKQLVMLIKGLV